MQLDFFFNVNRVIANPTYWQICFVSIDMGRLDRTHMLVVHANYLDGNCEQEEVNIPLGNCVLYLCQLVAKFCGFLLLCMGFKPQPQNVVLPIAIQSA